MIYMISNSLKFCWKVKSRVLSKKRIFVLGAGGLLGSQVVQFLLGSGASVYAADLHIDNMSERLQTVGLDIDAEELNLLSVDITVSQSLISVFDANPAFDGVVNCTYPRNSNYGKSFFEVSVDSFNENLSLHLGSAFLLMQQCAANFKKSPRPFSLVNMSSIYGVVAPRFDIYENTQMTMPVEYAAIKSAIIHLNRYVAQFISDSRFRVNSVSPGGVLDSQPVEFVHAYNAYCFGKGLLEPKDLMGGIAFLLSDHSRYVNGQNLVIDDGFSL